MSKRSSQPNRGGTKMNQTQIDTNAFNFTIFDESIQTILSYWTLCAGEISNKLDMDYLVYVGGLEID